MSWEDTIKKNDKDPNVARMVKRMLLDTAVESGDAEKLLTELSENGEYLDELNTTKDMRLKRNMSNLIKRSIKAMTQLEKELFR